MMFALAQGASPPGGRKMLYLCCIYSCNTQAYIKCIIDAYIYYPHMHAYITCLAAAAGNNGDFTVVLGISATEQQRCWQRCCT